MDQIRRLSPDPIAARWVWTAALSITLAVWATTAGAQLRPAHTGSLATADSAATVYANPAGMSRLDRPEFLFNTVIAYSKSQFEVDDRTTTDGGDADENDSFVLIPSVYYATPAFHDRIRIGFALNVPSGIGSDYGDEWAGRYVATESSLVYIAMNGAASLRVTDWLSLGAGIELLYTQTTSKSKINNLGESIPDGSAEYEASGIGVGGVVSTLIEFDRLLDFESLLGRDLPLRFGFSYRPKTETDVDGVPELEGVGPLLGAALLSNGLLAQRVELGTTSPQRVQVGLYVEPIERLSLTVDFAWIDMKQFGSVDISISDVSTNVDGDYKDMFMTGFSVGWEVDERLQLLAGFSYVSSPISDSKRSLSFPLDRMYIVGAGAKYQFRDWIELYGALNYYDTGESRIDTEPSPRSGRIAGEFSPHFAIAANLGVTFLF
jgi:long-chain fatty acid transport protein